MAQQVQEWAWVQYAGHPLFHQRHVEGVLAGTPAAAIEIVSSTPDGDVYCETYGGTDPNIAAVRWSDVRRPPPPEQTSVIPHSEMARCRSVVLSS